MLFQALMYMEMYVYGETVKGEGVLEVTSNFEYRRGNIIFNKNMIDQ